MMHRYIQNCPSFHLCVPLMNLKNGIPSRASNQGTCRRAHHRDSAQDKPISQTTGFDPKNTYNPTRLTVIVESILGVNWYFSTTLLS